MKTENFVEYTKFNFCHEQLEIATGVDTEAMERVTKDIGVICDLTSSEFLKLWALGNFR